MLSRVLQVLILGVTIFLSSTPQGMAKETIREEARACSFSADDELKGGEATLALSAEAALSGAEGFSFESRTDSGKRVKRQPKLTHGKNHFLSKCRIIAGLSAEALSKGVAKRPGSQDARQQRTSIIRFLHLAADIC